MKWAPAEPLHERKAPLTGDCGADRLALSSTSSLSLGAHLDQVG